jgi:hypothetical protein
MSNLYGIVRSYRPASRKSAGFLYRWTIGLINQICHFGISPAMPETDRKKLVIFNRLNLFQLAGGLLLIIALISSTKFSLSTYISLFIPLGISVLVLMLNRLQRYESALFSYFLLYPIATSNIYLRSINFGCELYFILFGILSIFFIQDRARMIFSIALSMTSYFVLAVLWKDYAVQVETIHPVIYLAVQVSAILLIFYALFLLKNDRQARRNYLPHRSVSDPSPPPKCLQALSPLHLQEERNLFY